MRYHWKLLDAGPLLLDGGSMFGVVPRVLWQKQAPADEANRITLGHNCLWLTPEGGGPAVVIETGSGDKFDEKNRAIFGLTDRSIVSAMAEEGLNPGTVGHVIVTHLHFDHAGGLTRRVQEGESPDWTSPDGLAVKLTWPEARVIVQEREWEDARANTSVMTRTYLREHLLPVEPRLQLLDSPLPFSHGQVPRRGEPPRMELRDRMTEALPGIHVFRVPGHTWGQQAVMFRGTSDRTIVFTPDVMPSVNHVGAAYSMAYDVEPYTTMITKSWFLAEAAAGGWTLVIDHEPRTPVVTVEPDGKGWYKLIPAPGAIG
jgi:glyoxylase-like metal-dependent hydrolase (beta-lactamase superfamily II)